MNKDNINKVIDHLERMRAVGNIRPFDMMNWFVHPNQATLRAIGGEDALPATAEEAAQLLGVMEGADFIPAEDRFKCDTVACIAGHTALVAEAEGAIEGRGYSVRDRAQEYLGLGYSATHDLFLPSLPRLNEEGALPEGYHSIKIEDAIFALKALRDTGKVSWPFAFHPRGESAF